MLTCVKRQLDSPLMRAGTYLGIRQAMPLSSRSSKIDHLGDTLRDARRSLTKEIPNAKVH